MGVVNHVDNNISCASGVPYKVRPLADLGFNKGVGVRGQKPRLSRKGCVPARLLGGPGGCPLGNFEKLNIIWWHFLILFYLVFDPTSRRPLLFSEDYFVTDGCPSNLLHDQLMSDRS